jgi:hypothetical protein
LANIIHKEAEPGQKRVRSHTSDKNFIALIDKDYALIRRFKTTTSSLHDSQIDLSKK